MVHDYQLTTIGNALKYFGYSFNSIDAKELAEAEKLLLEAKPHLFAINSDYQPSLRNGDAWMSVCWTGDGKQLQKTDPAIQYVLGKEGGEIWADFYAVPKGAPHRAAAYALINFLLEPHVNADEVLFHGYPVADKRVDRPAAEGDHQRSDPLSGGRAADAAGVRRGGDPDRPGPGRDHGAVQVGVSSGAARSAHCKSLPRVGGG